MLYIVERKQRPLIKKPKVWTCCKCGKCMMEGYKGTYSNGMGYLFRDVGGKRVTVMESSRYTCGHRDDGSGFVHCSDNNFQCNGCPICGRNEEYC